jgi:hypothetical protein
VADVRFWTKLRREMSKPFLRESQRRGVKAAAVTLSFWS